MNFCVGLDVFMVTHFFHGDWAEIYIKPLEYKETIE